MAEVEFEVRCVSNGFRLVSGTVDPKKIFELNRILPEGYEAVIIPTFDGVSENK